jgi:hypothetical protein
MLRRSRRTPTLLKTRSAWGSIFGMKREEGTYFVASIGSMLFTGMTISRDPSGEHDERQ